MRCSNFTRFFPHVSAMLRDRTPHELTWCGLMWVTCGTHVRYTHVFAFTHMCLTCEKCSFHVRKRVKLEQHMCITCEHMWDTCGPLVDSMWFFRKGRRWQNPSEHHCSTIAPCRCIVKPKSQNIAMGTSSAHYLFDPKIISSSILSYYKYFVSFVLRPS